MPVIIDTPDGGGPEKVGVKRTTVSGLTDNEGNRAICVAPMTDFWLQHAYNVIFDTYGDVVRIKPKNLFKFGATENADSGVNTTIMELEGAERHETYVNENIINTISSDDDGDAELIEIEGHTIANSSLTFVVQQKILDGQTPVTLDTPLTRATRMTNIDNGNVTGIIFCYQSSAVTAGTPNDASVTHIIIPAGKSRSEKAATAFSNVDYGIITQLFANIDQGNAVHADIDLEIREFGKVFIPHFETAIQSTGNTHAAIDFRPYIIVPKNADIRLTCTATANNVTIHGSFNSLIATVQS